MSIEIVRRHPLAFTWLLAGALVVTLTVAVALFITAENPSHAGSHLALAAGFLLVAMAAIRIWPAPTPSRSGRTSRRFLLAGCALSIVSLIAEAIGAFGYDGNAHGNETLTRIHNGAWPFAALGMLALLCAGLLALAASANKPGADADVI